MKTAEQASNLHLTAFLQVTKRLSPKRLNSITNESIVGTVAVK